MNKAMIAAVDEGMLLGVDVAGRGTIPWRVPNDLKRFRRLTMGLAVIMGRRTFESIGKPLPGRMNILVSSGTGPLPDEIHRVRSLAEAFDLAESHGNDGAFVIGGARLYAEAMPLVDAAFITVVHQHTKIDAGAEGVAMFPAEAWRERVRRTGLHVADVEREAGNGDVPACTYLAFALPSEPLPSWRAALGLGL